MKVADIQTLNNEQVDGILDKYPLLAEGYDALECPICDNLCFPQRKYSNGTVRYNNHACVDPVFPWNGPSQKSFSITESGDLKIKF